MFSLLGLGLNLLGELQNFNLLVEGLKHHPHSLGNIEFLERTLLAPVEHGSASG